MPMTSSKTKHVMTMPTMTLTVALDDEWCVVSVATDDGCGESSEREDDIGNCVTVAVVVAEDGAIAVEIIVGIIVVAGLKDKVVNVKVTVDVKGGNGN